MQRASIAETSEETFIPPVQKEYEMKCKPVELAIISLIEAQSEVAYCELNDASFSYCYNYSSCIANSDAWRAAIEKRRAAVKQLIEVIEADVTSTDQLSRI
jgi:hypothetical protein